MLEFPGRGEHDFGVEAVSKADLPTNRQLDGRSKGVCGSSSFPATARMRRHFCKYLRSFADSNRRIYWSNGLRSVVGRPGLSRQVADRENPCVDSLCVMALSISCCTV